MYVINMLRSITKYLAGQHLSAVCTSLFVSTRQVELHSKLDTNSRAYFIFVSLSGALGFSNEYPSGHRFVE